MGAFLTRLRFRTRFWNTGGGPVADALLQEDGSFILLEDGTGYLLLE